MTAPSASQGELDVGLEQHPVCTWARKQPPVTAGDSGDCLLVPHLLATTNSPPSVQDYSEYSVWLCIESTWKNKSCYCQWPFVPFPPWAFTKLVAPLRAVARPSICTSDTRNNNSLVTNVRDPPFTKTEHLLKMWLILLCQPNSPRRLIFALFYKECNLWHGKVDGILIGLAKEKRQPSVVLS